MKRTSITAGVILLFGVCIDAWVFTSHEWNPEWLFDVAVLPGLYLGATVHELIEGNAAYVWPCILGGLVAQLLLVGVFAGLLVNGYHRWNHRASGSPSLSADR